jgi:hypothetical protein
MSHGGIKYTGAVREAIEAAFAENPTRDYMDVAFELGASPSYTGQLWSLLRLRAFGGPEPPPAKCSILDVFRVCQETARRMDTLAARVVEGKFILEASEFVRWLRFSGIVGLCQANQAAGELPIDGAGLAVKCRELHEACNERLTSGDKTVRFENLAVESIVDRLAAIEAKLTRPESSTAEVTAAPLGQPRALLPDANTRRPALLCA